MVIKDVKQALLNAFNKENKLDPVITLDDVNWSAPEVWLQGQCNSRILITAKPTSLNFTGSDIIYYVRRNIAADLKDVKIPGKASDYTTLYEVLAVLRDKLGVPLLDNEFLDRPVTESTVKIQTTTVCLAYLPNGSITLEYAET